MSPQISSNSQENQLKSAAKEENQTKSRISTKNPRRIPVFPQNSVKISKIATNLSENTAVFWVSENIDTKTETHSHIWVFLQGIDGSKSYGLLILCFGDDNTSLNSPELINIQSIAEILLIESSGRKDEKQFHQLSPQ